MGSNTPTYSANDALNLSHSHKSITVTVICNYTVRSHTLPLAEPQRAHDAVVTLTYIYNAREHCMPYRPSSPTSCKTWVCMFDYQIMLLGHTVCGVFVTKLWRAELTGFLRLLLAKRQTWMCVYVYVCLSGHRQSREGHRNCRGSGPLPQNTGKCVTAVSVCTAKQLKQHILHARANREHYFVCSECQHQRKKHCYLQHLIKSCCPMWDAML